MSYTPTNWQTGDTITAEKMNNIESGISNSATGKIAVVNLSAGGFSSSSHVFGYIIWATWDGEKWMAITDNQDDWLGIYGYVAPYYRTLPPMAIPEGGTMYPFFRNENANGTNIETTGDISDTPELLYFSWGSPLTNCYRIAGSGSIQINAL